MALSFLQAFFCLRFLLDLKNIIGFPRLVSPLPDNYYRRKHIYNLEQSQNMNTTAQIKTRAKQNGTNKSKPIKPIKSIKNLQEQVHGMSAKRMK